MIALYPEELRAVMLTGAGDELTVQLHPQAEGGLGLSMKSPGFDEGRWPSAQDFIYLGSMMQTLALYAAGEGGR